ncbi:myo-inositol 2-dehydrogenase/D-chiro-inositol 1-dehydrogenase [Neorhizobium huautlense]|uniref:Myo-inositol 2-dehydrogenase/D-chiro-inositol 1-dehydrogenase n=1 Tax=Neorhizobium huautlense TaxID=67774 RepID=A0ABT9Q158_9HYPH|nr:inositol 2-dehydrogenase [Neorhizobium huautlense]MDP9839739.1 myo-inositol 2-dehydrogenase/D-chiro-inositol 1-dehydrogenase [Neorhizobium huautlense]
MIELALFGAGRIGQVHAANAAAHPSIRLKYIVDPIESADRDRLAAATGAAIVDAETVFSDSSLPGVVIASSTDTHSDILLRCAQTGKAVFCEKPISLDFATVRHVVERVETSGIPCLLGFQRRYDTNFRFVRDRIASGDAGKLEHVVMHTRDPSPPPRAYVERSGGMFRDQAIHDFDMARYLLGEEIATVYAVGNSLIDPDIAAAGDIDTAMITLTSRSGKFVQMVNCRRAPFGYDQRLEALCSREVLYVENRPQRGVTIADAGGFHSSPPMNYFIERFADAYRAEMFAFVDLIETARAPLAGIRDGLEAQRLAEAAIASMTRRMPIDVDANWQP